MAFRFSCKKRIHIPVAFVLTQASYFGVKLFLTRSESHLQESGLSPAAVLLYLWRAQCLFFSPSASIEVGLLL